MVVLISAGVISVQACLSCKPFALLRACSVPTLDDLSLVSHDLQNASNACPLCLAGNVIWLMRYGPECIATRSQASIASSSLIVIPHVITPESWTLGPRFSDRLMAKSDLVLWGNAGSRKGAASSIKARRCHAQRCTPAQAGAVCGEPGGLRCWYVSVSKHRFESGPTAASLLVLKLLDICQEIVDLPLNADPVCCQNSPSPDRLRVSVLPGADAAPAVQSKVEPHMTRAALLHRQQQQLQECTAPAEDRTAIPCGTGAPLAVQDSAQPSSTGPGSQPWAERRRQRGAGAPPVAHPGCNAAPAGSWGMRQLRGRASFGPGDKGGAARLPVLSGFGSPPGHAVRPCCSRAASCRLCTDACSAGGFLVG